MPEHLAIEISGKIYTHLFGLSRHEFIATAKTKQGYGVGGGFLYSVNDEDESARDCLSEKALEALAMVESNLAKYIGASQRLIGQSVTEKQWRDSLDYAVSQFAHYANDAVGAYEIWS